MVTGVKLVTTSQVQIIGVGSRPFCPAHNRWCVCVVVTTLRDNVMESDLGAQFSSYQKA